MRENVHFATKINRKMYNNFVAAYETGHMTHLDGHPCSVILIIIIIIRNLYSAIMPLGGYRGAGGTGR